MKEQLPAPEFNSNHYERPNQPWVCGWAAAGKCCKIGPSPAGECRATSECRPVLKLAKGETKGHWVCTRTKDQGGACEQGPLPDGTCCRAIPRCQPVRTLRAQRARFCVAVAALTLGVLLIGFCGPWGLRFVSPGEVSAQHRSFATIKGAALVGDAGCAACHTEALTGPSGWLAAAFSASPGPFEVHKLAAVTHEHVTTVDLACQRCHPDHNFHQPNVPREHSCTACHREHLGPGHIPHPSSENCISCHGNPQAMATAYSKGALLQREHPGVFDYRVTHGANVFHPPRPARGHTEIFTSFAGGHPEFQIHSQALKETNTLRFNHEKHLSGAIPPLNGKPLACADCHQPDTAGAYHRKLTFEANCKACHSLQFDERNPELTLPHGSVENVHAFVRSLTAQYQEVARRRGLTARDAVDQFVREQEAALRQKYNSGDELERHIFFSNERYGPVAAVAGVAVPGRAKYPGCAYCHEVKDTGTPLPTVTRPMIPDRWLERGQFQHSRHTIVDCTHCHQVEHSRDTADILLPRKALCATCHKPGSVSDACSTCHSYHTVERNNPFADAWRAGTWQMKGYDNTIERNQPLPAAPRATR